MWKIPLLIGVAGGIMLGGEITADKRLRNSADVLQDIMSAPDQGIPHDLFTRARCVIIVPGLKKAAVVVGGDYGRGFALCRSGDSWAGPAAIRMGGGSFGAQLGLESTDVLMLVMSQKGMDRLLSDKFTIGVDASAAIGPVGRTLAADTDATVRAELLTYARTKGAFAGVALNGTTITTDRSEDRRLYGEAVSNRQILRGQIAEAAGDPLVAMLNDYSRQGLPSATLAQAKPPSVAPPNYASAQEAPTLPQTASSYPAIAIAGFLLLAIGLGVRFSTRA